MAKRKIIISENDNIAALMEDDRAVEFIIHRGDMLLGDVYLATVENILPSIDAAFVNVGGDKMGFLHSSDVPGKGDLKNRLEPKQQLVVQIMKEPTGHKGPRVSTNISLPGRFLVMMPESKGISISRKIVETAERSRLKSVVSLIKPPGVGVIIRTEASNQKESDITEDFETLLERWQNIVSMADTASPPTLLYRDQDLLYRVIREAVTEDVTEIVVDTAFGQQRAQQLLQNWNMDKGVKVTHYQGNQPILVGTGVDKEIKLALNTKVPLPSGGYLYIQPTEALTVVDVNSGKFTSLQSQAETIKLTNLEACKEIARQLRLRNIGGMIIVDFIDMESRANQLTVLQSFENELAPDKSKPQIGQLSDLGLVEMTRHRQGQSLSEIFTRRCHSCGGTGHALEEFSWMHGGEGDGRGGRHQQGRSKLPTRQPNRLQQLPKPAASLSNKKDKARVALGNLAEVAIQKKGESQGPQSTITPGTVLLNNLANKKNPQVEQESWLEHFTEKLNKLAGVRLSAVAKLSFMPNGINSVLTRINPKANDIVTLVHSIENSAHMPFLQRRDLEESADFDEEGTDDSGDDAAEESVDEVEEASDERLKAGAAQGRNRRGRSLRDEIVSDLAESQVEPEEGTDEGTEAPEPVDALIDAVDDEEAELAVEVVEKPRRGRAIKRPSEISAEVADIIEELPVLPMDSELLDETDGGDEEAMRPSLLDDTDEVDDFEDGDDEFDGDESAGGTAVAVAQSEAAKNRRRGGRPAKRSLKKPPTKR
ncbi:Rne/Rng family ribonuclease [Vampirovibrio chlorellavorus]|uniref:Rne/Rng family ribonuclease n=1 Tax=Vampirovibrio chlorellavorus TaxID=758823 RepID=UPI0026EC3E17|nr:Rne/Rng family ribonuclease [Vampirovibrio chlorellavorus]